MKDISARDREMIDTCLNCTAPKDACEKPTKKTCPYYSKHIYGKRGLVIPITLFQETVGFPEIHDNDLSTIHRRLRNANN